MDGQGNAQKQKVNRFMRYHFQISERYITRQKPLVSNLKLGDTKLRILSFLTDCIFIFWPSMVFIGSILALTSPLNVGDTLLYDDSIMIALYCGSMLFFNLASSLYFHGQTFGKKYYGLKVVRKNNAECSPLITFIRELFGKGIPMAALFYYYKLPGFLAFCAVNAVFSLFDPKHRSIIDIFLGTKIVVLPGKERARKFEEALETEAQESNIKQAQGIVEKLHQEEPEIIEEGKAVEDADTADSSVQTEAKMEEMMKEIETGEQESTDLPDDVIQKEAEDPKEKSSLDDAVCHTEPEMAVSETKTVNEEDEEIQQNPESTLEEAAVSESEANEKEAVISETEDNCKEAASAAEEEKQTDQAAQESESGEVKQKEVQSVQPKEEEPKQTVNKAVHKKHRKSRKKIKKKR